MSEKHKNIVAEVNAAFAENKIENFLKHCAEDVVWTVAGEKTSNGRDAIREWMSGAEGSEPPKFTVDRMIANDDSVVCQGQMTMKGKDGCEELYSYCDVYTFTGDEITVLDSYCVRLKPETENQNAAGA